MDFAKRRKSGVSKDRKRSVRGAATALLCLLGGGILAAFAQGQSVGVPQKQTVDFAFSLGSSELSATYGQNAVAMLKFDKLVRDVANSGSARIDSVVITSYATASDPLGTIEVAEDRVAAVKAYVDPVIRNSQLRQAVVVTGNVVAKNNFLTPDQVFSMLKKVTVTVYMNGAGGAKRGTASNGTLGGGESRYMTPFGGNNVFGSTSRSQQQVAQSSNVGRGEAQVIEVEVAPKRAFSEKEQPRREVVAERQKERESERILPDEHNNLTAKDDYKYKITETSRQVTRTDESKSTEALQRMIDSLARITAQWETMLAQQQVQQQAQQQALQQVVAAAKTPVVVEVPVVVPAKPEVVAEVQKPAPAKAPVVAEVQKPAPVQVPVAVEVPKTQPMTVDNSYARQGRDPEIDALVRGILDGQGVTEESSTGIATGKGGATRIAGLDLTPDGEAKRNKVVLDEVNTTMVWSSSAKQKAVMELEVSGNSSFVSGMADAKKIKMKPVKAGKGMKSAKAKTGSGQQARPLETVGKITEAERIELAKTKPGVVGQWGQPVETVGGMTEAERIELAKAQSAAQPMKPGKTPVVEVVPGVSTTVPSQSEGVGTTEADIVKEILKEKEKEEVKLAKVKPVKSGKTPVVEVVPGVSAVPSQSEGVGTTEADIVKEILKEKEKEEVKLAKVKPVKSVKPIKSESAKAGREQMTLVQPFMAVKTNLAYWAAVAANLEVEFYFAKHWSALLEGVYTDWNMNAYKKHYAVNELSPEVRYWTTHKAGQYRGLYVGLYGHWGQFDYLSKDRVTGGKTGNYGGTGISAGGYLPFTPHFGMELGLRVGYVHAKYDRYHYETAAPHYIYDSSKSGNYFGLTGAKVSLVYRFGLGR